MNLQNIQEKLAELRVQGAVIVLKQGDRPSPVLEDWAATADTCARDAEQFMAQAAAGRPAVLAGCSGLTNASALGAFLRKLPDVLARQASVVIDDADFTSVYDAMLDCVQTDARFHLCEIRIDPAAGARAGHGLALLEYQADRELLQPAEGIPSSKNKNLAHRFVPAQPTMDLAHAQSLTDQAVKRWTPSSEAMSQKVHEVLLKEFPDGASPKTYWHDAYQKGFTEFFSWGHDQDFGFGRTRQGTMSTRHLEIVAESIQYGYLPDTLSGLEVLDVGCWTGGDVLALAGLGARVTAIEEHPISAAAARRMCELLEVPAVIVERSLYDDQPDWAGRFDVVYISGVIYHVTDPVLALRICFSYLKPGGRIVVETKASRLDGALCEYAGTHEKGWNWYAPTLETQGRWLVDAGFDRDDVGVHMRPIGRLLAGARKGAQARLPERAGFSRPNSWLEAKV